MANEEFKFFLPLQKVTKEKDGSRTVSGYATTETLDLDGEIVTLKAVKNALPAYMEWRNIRQMHQPIAVGVAQEANIDEDGLFLTSKIIDGNCIKLLDGDVLKGYSIGGRKLAKVGNKITEIELIEISLVDRPANPDCRINVAKAAKPPETAEPPVPEFLTRSAENDLQPEEMGLLRKFLGAFSKLVTSEPKELSDDEWIAQQLALVKHPDDFAHIVTAAPALIIGKLAADNLILKAITPLVDLEKREFSQREREASAESGAAMPDGSFPIKSKRDVENAVQAHGRAKDKGKAKAHIIARAKVVPGGEAALPEEWKPKAKAKEKSAAADIIDLSKNMSSVRCIADAFDCLQNAKRQMLMEGNVEGDLQDGELATRLANISKDLADIISQKAEHEGEEAVTLEDADDRWLWYVLNPPGAIKMSKTAEELSADKIELAKRAASTHKANVMKAKSHLDKALVHQAHGMSALAKCMGIMASAKKGADGLKPDELTAELTKANAAFEAMVDQQEVAAYNLGKAASAWGSGTGVPPSPNGSLTETSQSEMTEGDVPEYVAGEPYAGKGAVFTQEIADKMIELAAKAAKAEGKLEGLGDIKELLSKLPGAPKARLFALDKTLFPEVPDADKGKSTPIEKLLDGVVIPQTDDPDATQRAGAKMIANMIGDNLNGGNTFGKSPVHDANFRGQAQRKAA